MSWDSALGLQDEPRNLRAVPDRAARESTPSSPRPKSSRSNSPRARRRRRRQRELAATNKRLDIQGLRAVAVLAVVANHLWGKPVGGFVGVDVFFVISGFLITGHLLREDGQHGRISLLDFYRRRIRRLFPAALTVIAATLIAAYFVFGTGGRLRNTLYDGFFAAVFGANWRFLHVGTDYFQADGPTSPLQHYWSLSVEEQFYVVWPLVLIGVLALAKRLFAGRAHARTAAGALAAAALTVGSLGYAVVETSANPVGAYFSTFSRGWELGLGALLAVLAPVMRGGRRTLSILSFAGLAVIAVSYFTVTQNHFPFPGALAPCLGAAMVIIAATSAQTAFNPVLTNPVATYVGDISYSIYVVHFPVIILGQALVPAGGAMFDLTALFILFGLSALLFTLIENPIRSSNWLRPRREKGVNVAADRSRGRSVVLGAGLVVAGLCAFAIAAPPPPGDATLHDILAAQQRAAAAASSTAASTATGSTSTGSTGAPAVPAAPAPPVGPQARALSAQLTTATTAQSWPAVSPEFGADTPEENRGCAQGLESAGTCTWGDPNAPKTMYLIGDSTSAAYILTFAGVVTANPTWKMRAASGAGCPFANKVLNDADGNPWKGNCLARNASIVSEINQTRPDMVVVTSSRGDSDYTASVQAELALIKPAVKQIVVLPAPPQTGDPNSCKTAVSQPASCATDLATNTDYQTWMTNEQGMAQALGGTFVDTRGWFCATNGFCPVFVGTQPMKKDKAHITPGYAKLLAPVASEAFTALKLL